MGIFDNLSENKNEQDENGKNENAVGMPLPDKLNGTCEMLNKITKGSPWPITGGWGYDQESAIVFTEGNDFECVSMEYKLIAERARMELWLMSEFDGHDFVYYGYKFHNQSLVPGGDGRSYDMLNYSVCAIAEEDWNMLKADWQSHNGYEDDQPGLEKHKALRDSKIKSYESVCWFDITVGLRPRRKDGPCPYENENENL